MRIAWKRLARTACLFGAAVWGLNTSHLVPDTDRHQTRLIAHRGIHQIYTGHDRTPEACQAAPVAPVTHGFLENTLPSMQEAFRRGADVVEIDIHLTPDPAFAVFHDWTLDCRTDGKGVTRDQSLSHLKTLDLGYRIDDGTGFPLRGTGQGLLPSLTEVFAAEMPGQFLINFKSRDPEEGQALAQMLTRPEIRAQVFGVYGGAPPTQAALAATPGLRGFDRASLKSCLLRYAALGWSGFVPRPCRATLLLIPQSHAPVLWGWPHRFTRRMARAGTSVILAGPYDGSGFSSGIDTAAAYAKVPADFDGYLWTNRIERIGPLKGGQ